MRYQWALGNGDIEEAEYNASTDALSAEEAKNELVLSLEQFGHSIICEPVSDDLKEVYNIDILDKQEPYRIVVSIKGTTPGGRGALLDEQRIQQMSKYLVYAHNHASQGGIAASLGVYKRDNTVVFCAWQLKPSAAASDNPVSKQIKIATIADAMKEGFVQQDKGKGEFACAFRKEFIYFYLKNSSWLHGTNTKALNEKLLSGTREKNDATNERVRGGKNILLYGVPGSGKSYAIRQQYCNDASDPLQIERVVFHPDYSYADFVGQILPKVYEGTVTYEFIPGPFTKILKRAVEDPNKHYYLVIEEINRGNAPAILGDVFQLLDRDVNGDSEYGISQEEISRIVYSDPEHAVLLPSNLNILATMNTSDQNVFTLDTAFQRRWNMKMIENDVESAEHAGDEILDTGVKWGVFNKVMNDLILDNSSGMAASEDKRLGAYFVMSDDLSSENNGRFSEKVLKYLWDDAFKFSRTSLFLESYRSLEEVIGTFNNGTGVRRFAIFTGEVYEKLTNQSQNTDGE
ncbi:AAA family ATPase [Eubacteriales bacterium OttesenSCG-928-A19]|nr:AAA family ATPase [Eubacteriales bacterium OttesenSCG-928-A19]